MNSIEKDNAKLFQANVDSAIENWRLFQENVRLHVENRNLKSQIRRMGRADRSPPYQYGELNRFGEAPLAGSRWVTPAEMARTVKIE